MNKWLCRGIAWAAAASVMLMSATATADMELERLMQDPNAWAYPGGNYWNWRYSELNQINATNVQKIKTAWTFATGVLGEHEGGSLVLPAAATGLNGDTLLIRAVGDRVFAINLDSQEVLWEYAPPPNPEAQKLAICCGAPSRGLAYGAGKILLQQSNTALVALNVRDGTIVWSVRDADGKWQASTNTPHVVKDKVIATGTDSDGRGWVDAYDLKDGKRAWRAYDTGPDSDLLVDPAKTLSLGEPVGVDSSLQSGTAEQGRSGGGAPPTWFSFDRAENLLLYGTGSPADGKSLAKSGDKKWSSAIFARDVDTGLTKWIYQVTPNDAWHYGASGEVILADINIKGSVRKALVHFDKNGFSYTLDRTDGALLLADKFDPTVNWATHIDVKTGRPLVVSRYSVTHKSNNTGARDVCPSSLGAKGNGPASYSPKTGLFYVPTVHACMNVGAVLQTETLGDQPANRLMKASLFPAGSVSPGTMFANNAEDDNFGNFIAWDPTRGKIKWSLPERFPIASGALATAGDLVFYGTLEGYLKAIDANTGKLLWQFKTPSGIVGTVNTWGHRGKQYVGVLSGLGDPLVGPDSAHGSDRIGAGEVYKNLGRFTRAGGVLSVFSLP